MKPKSCFVNDDSSNLAALTGGLQSEGYDVRHALDNHDALVAFHTLPNIGIVLLDDLNMPVKAASSGSRRSIRSCRSSSLPRGPIREV